MSSEILKNILKVLSISISKETHPSLVLFDIDSTLVCTSPRTQFILREFAHDKSMKATFGSFIKPIENINASPLDWGIREPLTRTLKSFDGVDQEKFISTVRKFWNERFFSNEYLKHDTPYEDAAKYVNKVYETGCEIIYLTARDEHRMGQGTREQIANLGFPNEDHTRVLFSLKPKVDMEDTDFKANYFSVLHANWSKIYYFENEPSIIEQVERVRSDVNIIWMNSVHSRRSAEPLHLPQIKMNYKIE